MTSMPPTISVVVINYNRGDLLTRCLTSVLALTWRPLEVIVVDNASTDGSPEMVERTFGARVRLLRRSENSPVSARNQGFQQAAGEFILSLDNDIVLPDPAVLAKAVALFDRFPQVALLSLKIGPEDDPAQPLPDHWWYPVSWEQGRDRHFYTDYFSEGAAMFRAGPLRAVGGYDPDFFQYFENYDVAFKLIAQGHDLLYSPALQSVELDVRRGLLHRRSRRNYLILRNKLWLLWKYYPLGTALFYAVSRIGAAGLRAIPSRNVDYFLRGLWDGLFPPQSIRAQRRPMPAAVWQRLAAIRRGQFVEV